MACGGAAAPASAADIIAPEQGFRIHLRFVWCKAGCKLLHGIGIHQHGVILRSQFFQQRGIKGCLRKTDLLAAKGFHVFRQKILGNAHCIVCRQCGMRCQQKFARRARVKDCNRIGLARQIPGCRKPGKPGPHDGHTEFFGRQRQQTGLRAHSKHAREFKPVHGKAAAQILPQTGVLTGVIANAGNNAGQGQVPLKHLAGLALLALSHTGHEGAHIQIKRTGHPAPGRAFLCAVRLYFVQTLLIHHDDCSRWLGADMRCGKGQAAQIAAQNTNGAFRDIPESPDAKTLHTVTALMARCAVDLTNKHGAGIWGESL